MIRSAFAFSAVLSLVSLVGCSEPPVLACGSEEDARRFQGELERQTDASKLWEAISSSSIRCINETPAQKKIVQDALARWLKVTSVSDQRSAYAALPNEATDLRVGLLKATNTLGLLSEMDEKVSEANPDAIGIVGKKLTLSAVDVSKLSAKHKWLSKVLQASEVNGYRIYLTQSSDGDNDNPDRLLVQAPGGHEYEIGIMFEMYDPSEALPIYQVVRLGRDGHPALMIREQMLGGHGGSDDIQFFELATGKVIPRLDSETDNHGFTLHSSSASAGTGVSVYDLHLLKDDKGNLLYGIATEEYQPGQFEEVRACSIHRNYLSFSKSDFGRINQLTEHNNVDCTTLAWDRPRPEFSISGGDKKLSNWRMAKLLGQLVNFDRRDASDEALLKALWTHAPNAAISLIKSSAPPDRKGENSLADILDRLHSAEQHLSKLRWAFKHSPSSKSSDSYLRTAEHALSSLTLEVKKIGMTDVEIESAKELFDQYNPIRVHVYKELRGDERYGGTINLGYSFAVRTLGSYENAIINSVEPLDGPGFYTLMVRKAGMIDAVTDNGFSVNIPLYVKMSENEFLQVKKYKKIIGPQIKNISKKADLLYGEIRGHFDHPGGSPVLNSTSTAL